MFKKTCFVVFAWLLTAKVFGQCTSQSAPIPTQKLRLGINGHPFTSMWYTNRWCLPLPWNQSDVNNLIIDLGNEASPAYQALKQEWQNQFNYLKKLGLKNYRVDVNMDINGNIIWTYNNYNLNNEQLFKKYTALAKANGIELTVIIGLNQIPTNFSLSNSTHQNIGYQAGYAFASRFGKDIKHYILANELDGIAVNPSFSGMDKSHYYLDKVEAFSAYLMGLYWGVNDGEIYGGDGVSVKAINFCFYHNGFLQHLRDRYVPFDAVGYHRYNGDDSFISLGYPNFSTYLDIIHTQFQKPIWVDEFNTVWDANKTELTNVADRESYIRNCLGTISSKPYVEAAFIHELYSQTGHSVYIEANYGLIKCDEPSSNDANFGRCLTKVPFSATNSLKLLFEEVQYGSTDFVKSLYRNIGCRDNNDEPSLSFWSNYMIDNVPTRSAVVEKYIYEDYYKVYLDNLYLNFLSRSPIVEADPKTGSEVYLAQLRKGILSLEGLMFQICSSQEFWNVAQGNSNRSQPLPSYFTDQQNRNFLNRIDIILQDEYNYNWSASQYNSFLYLLNSNSGSTSLNNATRSQIVYSFITDQLFVNTYIQKLYSTFAYGLTPVYSNYQTTPSTTSAPALFIKSVRDVLNSDYYWNNTHKEDMASYYISYYNEVYLNKKSVIKNLIWYENYDLFINKQFAYVLATGPSTTQLDNYRYALKNGSLTREGLIVELYTSNLFWTKCGLGGNPTNGNTTYLSNVIFSLLGRSSTSTDVQKYYPSGNVMTNSQVVNAILSTDEYYNRFVQATWNTYVPSCSLSAFDKELYVAQMRTGYNQEDLLCEVLLSDGFWSKAIYNGYNIQNDPSSYFQTSVCESSFNVSNLRMENDSETISYTDDEKNESVGLTATPNPFSQNVKIATSQAGSNGSIEISDMWGRLVKKCSVETANDQSINWDGKDDSGIEVKPGLYLVKITGSENLQLKLIKQ